MSRQIKVDIVSDTVCPWCFVGKRRLEKAIATHKKSNRETTFNVSWHPFYLDPTVKQTEDKLARYERKFGKARMAQMIPYMHSVGEGVGIDFKYGGKIGNTRDSHRIIAEAGARGGDLQDRLVNALFHSYFEVNEDISSKEVLARIATEVGLFKSQEEGVKFLMSEQRGAEVDKEVEFNQYRRGITGVPHFIIGMVPLLLANRLGNEEVGGAQDPKVFEQIFAQLDKARASKVELDGEACLPDGSNC
jgi:predicted DsbA family dithiol-disulfide isomerase